MILINEVDYISKVKIAREIAKIYNERKNTPCDKEQFLKDCEVQSALNYLCRKLGVRPMHLNRLSGETGEMLNASPVLDKQ